MKAGKINVEIANELSISTTTIANWRKKAGIPNPNQPRRRYSETERNKAIFLMKEGKTNAEVSSLTGVSTKTLTNWRRKAGIAPSAGGIKKISQEQRDRLEILFRKNYTLGDIAKIMGITSPTVKRIYAQFVESGVELPILKKGFTRRTKYSDEELIELAFLNKGYGFNRFIEHLAISANTTFDLFQELKEFNGEDPYAALQNSDFQKIVTFEEYREVTGNLTIPPNQVIRGGGNGRRGSTASSRQRRVYLPKQSFDWGEFERNDIY